jgi:hypothetical protein
MSGVVAFSRRSGGFVHGRSGRCCDDRCLKREFRSPPTLKAVTMRLPSTSPTKHPQLTPTDGVDGPNGIHVPQYGS